jgi:glycosyltransferase involved in cell wall biosynthesis
MDIAIVAPCPIPYTIGGAENLSRWLQDYINDHTEHQAETIKLPTREFGFWSLIEAYGRFAELDLSGFDAVVSMKFPAWMIHHRNHLLLLTHPLRVLYDLYPSTMSLEVTNPPRPVAELLELLDSAPGRRDRLGEVLDRLDELKLSGKAVPDRLLDFPGPFLRHIVHWLDGVGLHPTAMRRYGAISQTVVKRAGYLPKGVECVIAHPPSGIPMAPPGADEGYIFTVSRLEEHKRVHLLVEGMRHCGNPDARLLVAGTGPAETELRERAAGDRRIEMLGRVTDERLAELYAHARAVAFVPEDEDYGFITVEAMRCRRPLLTARDSGGPMEFVEHERTGLVIEPTPAAVGAAIEQLTADPVAARRMGEAAARRVELVRWDAIVDLITAP